MPIIDWRWKKSAPVSVAKASAPVPTQTAAFTNRYPQFLGPDRNGVLPGPQLARDWKLSAPVELWRHAVGSAWSGFAIEGSRAITQEQRGEEELVVCYDLATGREMWSHSDRSRYATTIAGEGPRATPTIVGAQVFTMGGAGVLVHQHAPGISRQAA
jgi:outer membrane protein assembly factor BamB